MTLIPQTLAITLVFGLLALSRKNSGAAIGILVASILIWPEFLRIPIGLFEASAPRLIALMLVGRALVAGKHRTIPGCRVDHIVLVIWGWTILASIIADESFSSHVISMIGRGLDTVLIYFVVRFSVTSADDLKGLGRGLFFVAVIVGILGVVEATTTRSPYSGARAYRMWTGFESADMDQFRYGLLRAKGSTSIHIYFGMSMMLVTGMLWSINKGLALGGGRWAIFLGILGTLSSMSSGPWIACGMMFVLGLYWTKPGFIRPSIYLVILLGILLELASNRHFYHLIDYFVLDAANAWYRSRLIEIAASHLSEFWLVGVGSKWPIHWGLVLDGRASIDVVNHFLIVALNGGLPAMFLYIATHYLAISYVTTFWKSGEGPLRIVAFNLVCVLLALDFASMTASFFGPPLLFSNVLLALIVSVTQMRQTPDLPRGARSNSQTTTFDHSRRAQP
jgi:hypothetical protein